MTRMRPCLAVTLVLAALLVLAGCGSGNPAPKFAKPSGSFTVADLNGTYAFSMSGSNAYGFFTAAGIFQADGNGKITSAVYDLNSASNVFTAVPAAGTYAISPDGRGTMTLNSDVTVLNLVMVLTSSAHGLLVRFDTIASASGSFDRQAPGTMSPALLHGKFVFNLAGIAFGTDILQNAGVFSADGAGNITDGIADENQSGAVATGLPVSGTYTVGADGRGLMQLVTAQRTLNLAFYVADATHLKLIGIDTTTSLGGDAYQQPGEISNASLNGPYAFTVGGMSVNGAYAAGGVFTSDGNGHLGSGAEDVNDAAQVQANLPLSGTYALAANGRGTMTLSTSAGTTNFAIYPSSGGLQIIQLDTTVVSGGAAFAQTGGPFSNASIEGPYALNLTGSFNGGALDSLAQFTADGAGKLTGAVDYNIAGSLSFGLQLDGTYTISPNGRGAMALRSSAASESLAIYVAGPRVLFLDGSSNTVGLGVMEHQ